MHSHFNPNYSIVGKHHVVGKDLDTYGQSNIFDHDLLLLTIISMINELGGETLSPYISVFGGWHFKKKYALSSQSWNMMIEYVELLLRLC